MRSQAALAVLVGSLIGCGGTSGGAIEYTIMKNAFIDGTALAGFDDGQADPFKLTTASVSVVCAANSMDLWYGILPSVDTTVHSPEDTASLRFDLTTAHQQVQCGSEQPNWSFLPTYAVIRFAFSTSKDLSAYASNTARIRFNLRSSTDWNFEFIDGMGASGGAVDLASTGFVPNADAFQIVTIPMSLFAVDLHGAHPRPDLTEIMVPVALSRPITTASFPLPTLWIDSIRWMSGEGATGGGTTGGLQTCTIFNNWNLAACPGNTNCIPSLFLASGHYGTNHIGYALHFGGACEFDCTVNAAGTDMTRGNGTMTNGMIPDGSAYSCSRDQQSCNDVSNIDFSWQVSCGILTLMLDGGVATYHPL